MASWFNARRIAKATGAYNKHEGDASHIQGGTGIVLFDELIQYASKKGCVDFRGLGRWTSWVLSLDDKQKTRFVVAYSVGKGKSFKLGSVYQQTIRYIQNNGLATNPRRLFETDLHAQLCVWRGQGENLVIVMDANEHVLDGKFCRRLLADSKLGLVDISRQYWQETPPNTYIRGKDPIDTLLTTSEQKITDFLMQPEALATTEPSSSMFLL